MHGVDDGDDRGVWRPSMKRYIGDGVYVAFDGFALTLTTENGVAVTNTIYLEPEVWAALNEFVAEMRKRGIEA